MNTFINSHRIFKMDINKVIYSINIEDVQKVAEDELGRELSENEVKIIEERIGDNISWYDAICLTINDLEMNQ